MSEYSDKLTEMVNNVDDQVSALNDSTAQLITQITELEEQRDAIQYGLLDEIAIDMSGYLEIVKLPDVGGSYITFGADYNVLNVTDWVIYDVGDNPVYIYDDIIHGWDGDVNIIVWEDKWQFGYNYINQAFGLNGTYGLQARIDQLENGLSLLVQNKDKIEGTEDAFSGYDN